MADLDAELLALAGDSSDDEGKQQTQGAPPGERDGSPDDDADRIATAPRQVKRPVPRRPARRRESDEDDNASSGSIDDGSVPMDESDDGGLSRSGDASGPLFPVDNKFQSEEDKEYILGLPEIQREEILADRARAVEKRKQDIHLRQMFDDRKDGSKMSSRKRQAEAAGLEGGERKSTRQRKNLGGRKVGEVSSSIEAYKEQRARRGERKAAPADRRRGRRSSSASDVDAEGESEVEWDSARKQDSQSQYEEPADLADFNRVHVGRLQFAKYCFHPTFEATVKDCYVRVALAPEKPDEPMTYRMAKIEAIKHDGLTYAIDNENGAKFKCKKYVVASIGKSRREWPFIFCSSGRPNEREFTKYKSTLATEQVSLPKKSFLVSKIQNINKLINYTLSNQEINQRLIDSGVIEEREKKREKVILIGQRNNAERESDRELMQQLDHQIKELEGPIKLAFGTSMYKPVVQKTKKTEGERLAEINRANRKANTENVRRAQIAEAKAAAEHRARVERGEATANPFARVKIRPKTHFDANAGPAAPKQPMTEAEIAKRIAEEKEKEDAELAKNAVPEALAKLMNGEAEVQPGKIDFAKYDIMYQFGKLSQKKKPGQQSIFKRKLFDMEVLGTYDLGLKVDMDW